MLQITKDLALTRRAKPDPKQGLPFGRLFTDNMMTMRWTKPGGWGSAHIAEYQNLSIPPSACGIHYGQSGIEGIRAMRGRDGKIRVSRLYDHLRRFARTAERLCLPCPDIHDLAAAIAEFIKVEESWVLPEPGCSLYLRPLLLSIEPYLGLDPGNECLLVVIASPIMTLYTSGLKIKAETKHLRAAPGGLGSVKASANYAQSIYPTHLAQQQGYRQVLWLDETHELCGEMGSMNLFAEIGDTIVTPELTDMILAGLTRDMTMTMLRDKGFYVEERPLSLAELVAASKAGRLKSVFGTGTAATVCPVTEIGYGEESIIPRDESPLPVTTYLLEAFDTLYGGGSDPHGWMTEIAL